MSGTSLCSVPPSDALDAMMRRTSARSISVHPQELARRLRPGRDAGRSGRTRRCRVNDSNDSFVSSELHITKKRAHMGDTNRNPCVDVHEEPPRPAHGRAPHGHPSSASRQRHYYATTTHRRRAFVAVSRPSSVMVSWSGHCDSLGLRSGSEKATTPSAPATTRRRRPRSSPCGTTRRELAK